MVKFICTNCSYSIQKDKKPRQCPYCGKETLRIEEDADEILSKTYS